MVTYIYFVKCPNCEDEHFDFFDDAKAFARGCMSQKPIITQTEVCRNDFGECTDSSDLGTVWSWEDEVSEPDVKPETTFSKDDIKADYDPDADPEFTDDDFFAINDDLLESTSLSFATNADQKDFFRLCSEIGIVTGKDLKKFMDEMGADEYNVFDKLKAYRAELGPDFKLKENLLEYIYNDEHNKTEIVYKNDKTSFQNTRGTGIWSFAVFVFGKRIIPFVRIDTFSQTGLIHGKSVDLQRL